MKKRPPPRHFTPEHQRAAGRKRAAQFKTEELSAAGRRGAAVRTAQESFYRHLCTIAPDGSARQRVKMRAPKGSRLLKVEDVHLVRLEDIHGNLGEPLPEEKQRLLLARYVWAYIWSGLQEPTRPTQKEFSALAARARDRVNQGLALLHPLDVVGVAPNDFCNADGHPYCLRNQRKLFRQALREARDYACLAGQPRTAYQEPCQASEPQALPRMLGRRQPMNTGRPFTPGVRPPQRPIHWRPIYQLLERSPSVASLDDDERTSALARAAAAQGYWLPPGTPTGDEPEDESDLPLFARSEETHI